MLPYNGRLKTFSRQLRRDMTDAENLLWSKLKRKQLKGAQFYRQKIISNHIVDFYCPKAKLVIELDGGQHYDDEGLEKDAKRDKFLNDLGLEILRFSDREVFTNINGVLEVIYGKI